MVKAYGILGDYYDRLMSGYDYEGMFRYIISSVKGRKGLDLACGTGKLTAELQYNGYTMTGLDISVNMLNKATERARCRGLIIPFIQGDINNLEIQSEYDFITATCDALNYVEPDNLNCFFRVIGESLKADGILIFDFSSKYKLNTVIGDNVFYEDYEDLTYIWTNKKKEKSVEMNLVFFVKEKDNYIRYEENHIQYIHNLDEIKEHIINSGLYIHEILDGDNFGIPNEKSERILIRAGKKDGQN